jgi:arylsulfatase A-like enzyme
MRPNLNRRSFLKTTAGGLAAGRLLGGAHNLKAMPPRRPNIIVILADDLGYADVGFQGCRDIPTPNIDSLAREGVRFTSGFVSHPFCSPTRAGLMTGRYQQRFGHENNPRYDPGDATAGLPLDQVTLPQVLSGAGYATGIVGKWHLGATPAHHPTRRGFQEQFGFIGGGHDYFKADPNDRREYFIPIERNGKPVTETEYLTDAFSREAAAFIRRHQKDPFFLYLAYNAPHTPLQAPEKYLDRLNHIEDKTRRSYAALISGMDDGIGRVLAALRELKLDSDTLVFFLSDNGGPTKVTNSSNAPLRGAKGQVYEGGIRVPFVARWTGRLPAGKLYDHPVIALDISPTAAALAGARLPEGLKLDGADLMPHLLGKPSRPPHDRLFWRTGGGAAFAVREGRYKLVRIGEQTELYDLETDIGESKDLSASHPDVVKKLDQARQQWNGELKAPLFESPRPAAKKNP